MLDASDMTGRVAIVTGAAAGLGRATALKLAGAGADICLVDIDAAGLEGAARAVEALGVRALAKAADLSNTANCAPLIEAAVEAFGRLDALCNVAGVFLPAHTVDQPAADFDRTIAVNLAAPFYLIQAAIPHLLKVNGAVVNVTSCAAIKAQAYSAAYCATKAGLTHMTRSLAMEYSKQPIRFNAVAPGGMMTALASNFLRLKDMDAELMGRVSPPRGVVEIEDVAAMVAFLASDSARGYHGACISIDNGIAAD